MGPAAGNDNGEKMPILVIGEAEKRKVLNVYRVIIGPKRNIGRALKSLLII